MTGTLVRQSCLAVTGGIIGGLGEWAGMPREAVGLLVVLTVALGATALFFRFRMAD